MNNPLADLIAARVSRRDAQNIPVPKYMLAMTISAITLDELHQQVDEFATDMATDWAEYEQLDATGGGSASVHLDVTNREQTPERYAEQLTAWRNERRSRKSGGTDET